MSDLEDMRDMNATELNRLQLAFNHLEDLRHQFMGGRAQVYNSAISEKEYITAIRTAQAAINGALKAECNKSRPVEAKSTLEAALDLTKSANAGSTSKTKVGAAIPQSDEPASSNQPEDVRDESMDEVHCPVCGYYCNGKGGIGCIDKPVLCGLRPPVYRNDLFLDPIQSFHTAEHRREIINNNFRKIQNRLNGDT